MTAFAKITECGVASVSHPHPLNAIESNLGKYVVSPHVSIFVAAEKSLDNGIHLVFVIDDTGVLKGCVTLARIREAIVTGEYLECIGLSRLIQQAPDTEVAEPVQDGSGRLVDVRIKQSAAFVPVAEPMLSHREFRYLMDAYLSTWISSTGDYIRRFETQFAAHFGFKHAVATSNGTVSLHLALRALGVGPGDEVIVPDFTFAASANAVIYCGATPILIDVDPDTWCITPSAVERAITPRTKAVMPVHVFGRVAPVAEIAEVAAASNIYVVEDCAEAHGAAYGNRYIGQYSAIASFSFFANKIITSGEGGMCVTQSSDLARAMQTLRDHGMSPQRRYWHEQVGYNYRMTNMQAAVGLGQLERVNELLSIRQHLQRRYTDALVHIPGVKMASEMQLPYKPVVWFVCATVPKAHRASLIEACRKQNIDLRPFFNSLSSMPAYKQYARDNEVSRHLGETGVNLPTSHRIDDNVIGDIVKIFTRILQDSC